jgi:two-component system response regulator LytT
MQRHDCWIIEDEPPALRRLQQLITQVRPDLDITFTTDTVNGARKALSERPHPRVIFSDIHLADGLSFQIWESTRCDCPVIFTTAYDQYGIRAFRVNSIDYLLKPIETDALQRALTKLDSLQAPTLTPDYGEIARLIQQKEPVYRKRFLAQHRQEWLPVKVEELRQIYSEDSLTFALTSAGQRYLLDETLDRIEEELDPRNWFRINRGQIIHVEAVRKVQPYFNHRLALELFPESDRENIVSRQRVKACRAWLGA